MQPPIVPAGSLPPAAGGRDPSESASSEQLQALLQLVQGYRVSQALYVVAKLGLADLLADGPQDLEELAQATTTHAPTLFRLLRFLAGIGVFDEVAPRQFGLTPLGAGLRTDHPGSLRPQALLQLDESHWRPWSQLLHSVQTGDTAFAHEHGLGYFEYLNQHPDTAALFNQALTGKHRIDVALTQGYDWSGIGQLVDVGGGQGWLLATILRAYPTLRGVLFDQPEVVAEAPAVLEQAGVAERCRIEGGDFFQAVPEGGDAYVLRSIVHDWDDEQAQRILEQCRRAIPEFGRLLVVEQVVGTDYRAGLSSLYSDMEMLVSVGGRARTEAEYRTLFADAGFRLTKTVPLGGAVEFSVLEGSPA